MTSLFGTVWMDLPIRNELILCNECFCLVRMYCSTSFSNTWAWALLWGCMLSMRVTPVPALLDCLPLCHSEASEWLDPRQLLLPGVYCNALNGRRDGFIFYRLIHIENTFCVMYLIFKTCRWKTSTWFDEDPSCDDKTLSSDGQILSSDDSVPTGRQ